MATLFIISLASSEPTHFHQLSFFSHSPARSLALHFTFSLSPFNNHPSFSNEGVDKPSEATWLSKQSRFISKAHMGTRVALERACSEEVLLGVCSSSGFVLIYPLLFSCLFVFLHKNAASVPRKLGADWKISRAEPPTETRYTTRKGT